jgi:hypothetical protein
MYKHRSIILAAATLLTLPTAVLPASGGAQLSAWCDARLRAGPSGRADHRHLMGYVQGATDALIEHHEACPPDEANVGHGVDIVCRYVASKQRWGSLSKYMLTKEALAKAFPCPQR